MHRAAKSDRRRGFSLIELMIVIVIIAIAATGVSFGMGALTQARLRSPAMRLLAATRFSYHRAISKGTTVRVVLDTDADKLSIEEAHGRVVLASASDRERADEDENATDDAVDPWEAAKQRLEQQEGPARGRSPFAPIADEDGDPIDRYTPHPLESGIRIVKITTPHETRPRTTGKGSLYFFPNGDTEHALVQLADPADHVITIEISPLTGRGVIHDGAYEPEELDDLSNALRDPG